MTEENKDVVVKTKEKIYWKTVWTALGIVFGVLIVLQGIIAGGRYISGQIREFREYKNYQQYDRQDDRHDDGPHFRINIDRNRGDINPFDQRRNDGFGGIFRESIPPNTAPDTIRAIADAFRIAAGNDYRNKNELLADLNRSLQGTCGKEWIPFFKAILDQSKKEGVNSIEEMKAFLIRTADEIESAREVSVPDTPAETVQTSLPAADTPPSCPSPAADQPEQEQVKEEKKPEEPAKEEVKPAEEPKQQNPVQSNCANGQCWRY